MSIRFGAKIDFLTLLSPDFSAESSPLSSFFSYSSLKMLKRDSLLSKFGVVSSRQLNRLFITAFSVLSCSFYA